MQDTWRDEGKESSSAPAPQIPYLTRSYCAADGLQSLLPSQKSRQASLLPPRSCCHLQRPGAAWTNIVFRKARLIASFRSWHAGHCVVCPVQPLPLPPEMGCRSSPSS